MRSSSVEHPSCSPAVQPSPRPLSTPPPVVEQTIPNPPFVSSDEHTVWVNFRPTAFSRELFPLPLPGTERINFEIAFTDTVAGPLDERRLARAFEDALTMYPHVAGRLRRNGIHWTIEPGQRGIPITFVTTDEPFNHYEHYEASPERMIDSCMRDISGASDPDWDEPMLQLRVTYCRTTNETTIGWSSSHIIGDGEFCYQFLVDCSQCYQHKRPIFGRPTYEKHTSVPTLEPNDNPTTGAFVAEYLPHLKTLYPMEEWMGMVGGVMASTSQVELMFTKKQMEQFRAVADAYSGRKPGTRTSAQDATSAYLITTLNRVLPVPITKVSSMFSFRGVENPEDLGPDDWRAPSTTAQGNAIFQAFTPTLSLAEATSLGAVAVAIRESLKGTREYEHVKRVVAVSEPIWTKQSTDNLEHKFWADEGTFVVNSLRKINLNDWHFGYGRCRTRVVLYGSFAGFARFFHAPAVKLGDGSWDAHEGAMGMTLRVPTEIKDRFLALVADDLLTGCFPQNLLWREREAKMAQAARL